MLHEVSSYVLHEDGVRRICQRGDISIFSLRNGARLHIQASQSNENHSLLSAHRERGLSRCLARKIDKGKGGRSTSYESDGLSYSTTLGRCDLPVTKRTSTMGPARRFSGAPFFRVCRTEVLEDRAQHLGFHFRVQVGDVDGPAPSARRHARRPRSHLFFPTKIALLSPTKLGLCSVENHLSRRCLWRRCLDSTA